MKTYETGATSHAVNDLILFTDNTKELADIRDRLYASFAHPDRPKLLGRDFRKLFHLAQSQYMKEFPNSSDHKHIYGMGDPEINEYCKLYADDFDNWKSEHGYK